MKEEIEHIDDFISKKLEGKEFSYSEEYWLSAEKLIEETNTRKRMMILLFVVLLVFLLTTIFLFSNAFKSGEENAERQYGNNSSSLLKKNNTEEQIKTNADNANKPRQAIMIASTANAVKISPVRCTSAYIFAKLSSRNV